ncbi:MAG: AAA family ATPase, partial [Gemmataceae bacterium]
ARDRLMFECLADDHRLLLLSPPGVGLSDTVVRAAAEANLRCRSVLGTQIAPEDVSGIPRIVGERSVFCPPRVLLPEAPEPFCLFLDELPACAPEIQKAFYSLLLERRLGEHPLPKGTWVVGAGNRVEDRALVRSLSSALINRVIILQIRVDLEEWLAWASENHIRDDVIKFIESEPEALLRPVPDTPGPFSTPRAWAALSEALSFSENNDLLSDHIREALAHGRVSPKDAVAFCKSAKPHPIKYSDESDSGPDAPATGKIDSEVTKPGFPCHETPLVTLSEAKALIQAMAHSQSLLLLSPPGVGKSETVYKAAEEAGLSCRSLLGTQIAPEDVSGIPRIVGERSVFCPPRVLLPEDPEPFCLFLDELPACSVDVQKAFYSLLLERRLGEHHLPDGTWVVAAGNRQEDRALVRTMSSALINRVTILHIRVDPHEWLTWAEHNNIRQDIRLFIGFMPETLMRPVPADPVPFSTPRAWALLSDALDKAEQHGILDSQTRRVLAFGRLSATDAAVFCKVTEEDLSEIRSMNEYIHDPGLLPTTDTARWFVLTRIRHLVETGRLTRIDPHQVNGFLRSLPQEHICSLLVGLVPQWGELGGREAMLELLHELTGGLLTKEDPKDRERILKYIHQKKPLPKEDLDLHHVLSKLRDMIEFGEITDIEPDVWNAFLRSLSLEQRCTLVEGLAREWGQLGAREAMWEFLQELTRGVLQPQDSITVERIQGYIRNPQSLPEDTHDRYQALTDIRDLVDFGELKDADPAALNELLRSLHQDERGLLLQGLVRDWGELGMKDAMREFLEELTGV